MASEMQAALKRAETRQEKDPLVILQTRQNASGKLPTRGVKERRASKQNPWGSENADEYSCINLQARFRYVVLAVTYDKHDEPRCDSLTRLYQFVLTLKGRSHLSNIQQHIHDEACYAKEVVIKSHELEMWPSELLREIQFRMECHPKIDDRFINLCTPLYMYVMKSTKDYAILRDEVNGMPLFVTSVVKLNEHRANIYAVGDGVCTRIIVEHNNSQVKLTQDLLEIYMRYAKLKETALYKEQILYILDYEKTRFASCSTVYGHYISEEELKHVGKPKLPPRPSSTALAVQRAEGVDLREASATLGDCFVTVRYDADRSEDNPTALLRLQPASGPTPCRVWYGRAVDNAFAEATVPSVIGERVFSVQIVTQPRGCDNENPLLADLNSNCVTDGIQTQLNYEKLHDLWAFPFYGDNADLCLNGGGSRRDCLGTPKVTQYNTDSDATDVASQLDLLTSTGVYILSGKGPLNMVPVVTRVDMVVSKLGVLTNCTYPPLPSATFQSQYDFFPFDAFDGSITVIPGDFRRADGALSGLRVLIRRQAATGVNALNFYLEFADAIGVDTDPDTFFNTYYRANLTLTTPFTPALAAIFNTTVTMLAVHPNATQCTAMFYLIPAPSPAVYRDPALIGLTNYANNVIPPAYYQDLHCGFVSCSLTATNQLKYPWCPEGGLRGGFITGVCDDAAAGYPRCNFTRNVNYRHYVMDCVDSYPRNFTFYAFGETGFTDVAVRRLEKANEACNSPFLLTAKILANENPQERQQQCFRLGQKHCAGRTCAFCTQVRSKTFCRLGWIYFDGYCYYKFDPTTQTQFKVNLADSQRACDAIDPGIPQGTVRPLAATDDYTQAWIVGWFMYWKVMAENTFYRFVRTNGGCEWYGTTGGSGATTTDWVVTVDDAICETPAFPFCRYYYTDLPIVDMWDSMHPLTVETYKRGVSDGVNPNGRSLYCQCLPGSTGPDCNTRTCITPNQLTPFNPGVSPDARDLIFFQKCYSNKRGACYEGQPLACQCFNNFGPYTSLLPNFPNPDFENFPCACPGTLTGGPFIKINGTDYVDTLSNSAVCGGSQRGECFVDPLTNLGACACTTTLCTSENGVDTYPCPINGGPSCQCPIPIIPPFGFSRSGRNVVQLPCNGRGTCCPANDETCVSRVTGQPYEGCADSCENGVAGTSCTCPTALNLAFRQPVITQIANVAYVRLPKAALVLIVTVEARVGGIFLGGFDGCNVTSVGLSNNPTAANAVTCTEETIEGVTRYLCDNDNVQYFYVMVGTLQVTPRCIISAFSDDLPPGGKLNHTNPFAARFFRSNKTSANTLFQYMQRPAFASNGCTDTDVMCSPDFDGSGCEVGVSQVVPGLDGRNARRVCGENTLPPRGKLVRNVENSGIDRCECQGFTATGYSGLPNGPSGAARGRFGFPEHGCPCLVGYNPDLDQDLTCTGYGRCIFPSFPYGVCKTNLEAYLGDPLYRPFVEVLGAVINEYYQRFLNRVPSLWDDGLGDMRSVVAVYRNGSRTSWFVDPFQNFQLVGVVGDIGQICGHTVRTAMDIYFVTSDNVGDPVRAIADVTIWRLDANNNTVETQETCDPGVLRSDEPYACSTIVYCLATWLTLGSIIVADTLPNLASQPCIARQIWRVNENETADALPDCFYTVDFLCSRAQSTELNPDTVVSGLWPTLRCNNALERLLDDKLCLAYCTQGYVRQCGNFPIQWYSFVLGSAYGLWDGQIPDVYFYSDRSLWTVSHYQLIASLMNFKRAFDSRGRPVDVLNDQNIDQYYLSLVTRVPRRTSNSSQTSFFDLNPEGYVRDALIRPTRNNTRTPLFNYMTLFNVSAQFEPSLTYETRPSVHEYCVQYYPWSVRTMQLYQTLGNAATTDPTLQTFGQDIPSFALASLHQRRWIRYSRPGYIVSIVGVNANDLLALNVTFSQDLFMFAIYTAANELCAVKFHVLRGQSQVFACDNAADAQSQNVATSAQTYFETSIDISNEYVNHHNADAAFAALSQYQFMANWFQGHVMDEYNGLRAVSVPEVFKEVVSGNNASLAFQYVNDQLLNAQQYPNASNVPYADYEIDIAAVTVENNFDAFFANYSEMIYVEKRWPYNTVYDDTLNALIARGIVASVRDINSSDPLDQKYLYDAWVTFLAPPRCSEDWQCGLPISSGGPGDSCVFDSRLHVAWRNGDAEVPSNGIGDEGGCACFFSGDVGGFREPQSVGCQLCRSGYGPNSVNAWLAAVEYQAALEARYPEYPNPLFDPETYPFSALIGLQGRPYRVALIEQVECKVPWDDASAGLVAAGRGRVNFYQTRSNATVTVFRSVEERTGNYMLTCSALRFANETFSLVRPVQDIRSLLYEGETDSFTVIDNVVRFTAGVAATTTVVVFEACSMPDDVWTCDTNIGSLQCINDLLYSQADANWFVELTGYETKAASFWTRLVVQT